MNIDTGYFENEYKNCYFYYLKLNKKLVEKIEKLNGEIINSIFIIDNMEIEKKKNWNT